MAVANFFSGVEGQQHWDAAVSAGAKHVLMSYLYLRKTGVKVLYARKKKNPDLQILIDSGAHTLQTNVHEEPYKSWKLVDYEKYLNDYVNWLKKHRKIITYAAELDISYPLNVSMGKKGDDPYGHQIVERWRRTVFAPLQDIGIEIIYVWHGYNGMQGWEQMCEEYPYVGLPGELSSKGDFNKFISVARRFSTKIHGFAATKQIDFSTWPWFSVDSTSWKSGERYGTIMHWDERKQKIKVYEKHQRPLIKSELLKYGFNADDIIADKDYREVTRYTLFSMVRMENFYKNRFADRVFYYELRLPPPVRIKLWKEKKIMRVWSRFEPNRIFGQHGTEHDPEKVRWYLMAIASVQNDRMAQLNGNSLALNFLECYWPKHMAANPKDMKAFKTDMSTFTAPRNKAAEPRLSAQDYKADNNPPKRRDIVEYELEDLEWDVSRFAYMKEMIPLSRN